MRRTHRLARLATAAAFACVLAVASTPAETAHLEPSPTRHAPTDLELTGLLPGLAPGSSAFLTRSQLLTLPQVTTTGIVDDENFPPQIEPTLRITGIPLEALAQALGIPPSADLIDALCTDRYRTHYPASYVAAHHPILALQIDGMWPEDWAALTHQRDPGPYFITHTHFVPAFTILAHKDEPQVPENVTRLNFTTAAQTYGPITPPRQHAPDSPVAQGFAIAKQNCLRCHNQGNIGGTKSGLNWLFLSTIAINDPTFFDSYVKDPKKINPNSNMAPNPDYDAPTLAALTAYFRAFQSNAKPAAESSHP